MNQEIKEIMDFRRNGVSFSEWWEFILKSPKYQKAWSFNTTEGKLDLKIWSFLLSPLCHHSLLKWEKKNKNNTQKNALVHWWSILLTCPGNLRAKALNILAESHSKLAIPYLTQALTDRIVEVRASAATNLAALEMNNQEVLTALKKAFGDKNKEVRERAKEALLQLGPKKEVLVPVLIESISNKEMSVRRNAVIELGKTRFKSPEIVSAFVQALQDESTKVRWWAAKNLGKMGNKAQEAIPALIDIIYREEHSFINDEAKKALKKIDPEQVWGKAS